MSPNHININSFNKTYINACGGGFGGHYGFINSCFNYSCGPVSPWGNFSFGMGCGFGSSLGMFFGNMFNMFGMPGLFGGFNIWNLFGNSNQSDRTSNSSGCQCKHCGQDNSDKVKEEEDKVSENSETPKDNKVEKKRRLRDKREIKIEHDCPDKAIADEMERVGKEALKQYLKTGKYTAADIPIPRAKATITTFRIIPAYDLTNGTKNDHRNEDGNIVRVADGTVIKFEYEYEGKTYTCKLTSHKTPRKGGARTYTETKNTPTLELEQQRYCK